MWISRRRTYWCCIVILTMTAVLLVPTTRSFVDQAMLRFVVHPGITVDRLHVHYDKSVVQASRIQWTSPQGDRTVRLEAANTWLAVEAAPLVDRHLHSKRILIEDALVTLAANQARERTGTSEDIIQPLWQHNLTDQVADFAWDDLSSRFDSVAAAAKIATRWSQRLTKWQQESEAILAESASISADLSNLDNPLRDEDDLRARMHTLMRLEDRQQRLATQFDGVREFLEAERDRLRGSHQAEQDELTGIDVEQLASTFAKTSVDIAEEILQELVIEAWRQHADLMEGPARLVLGPAMPRQIVSSFEVPLDEMQNIDLLDVSAHGIFKTPSEAVPFSMQGAYASTDAFESYRWDFQFDCTECKVFVTVKQTADSLTRTLEINKQPGAPAALRGRLTTSGEQIGGQFELNPCELTISQDAFAIKQVVSSYASVADAGGDPITFRVSGSWAEPRFNFAPTDLGWLRSEVERRTRKTVEDRIIEASDRAASDFESRLASIDHVVEESMMVHQRIAGEQVVRLSNARKELQRRLADIGSSILR